MFRIEVKIASRTKGRSVVAMACYRSASKIFDRRLGVTHNYRKKTGVTKSLILAPHGTPEPLLERESLWNEVENFERRKDAQLTREFLLSLPRNLTVDQNISLAKDWVNKQLVSSGMIADISFHDMVSRNPHAHVMTTMRKIDKNGFGHKVRSWNSKLYLTQWRQSWAESINKYFNSHGIQDSVDHRSYINQLKDIDELITTHSGAIKFNRKMNNPSRKPKSFSPH